MADQTFTAHLFGRSRRGDREEVLLKIFNFEGGEGALPAGGPGVLVREEEDGVATWSEVEVVNASSVPATAADPLTEDNVQSLLNEIAELLATSAKGVVVWDGTGSQPARPTAYISVEFVQDADPDAVALDGDTWVSEVV